MNSEKKSVNIWCHNMHINIIRDRLRENIPSDVCDQLEPRSACAFAQSDHWLHEESIGPKLFIKCKMKTLVRCTDAQVRLNVGTSMISEGPFPDDGAQMYVKIVTTPEGTIKDIICGLVGLHKLISRKNCCLPDAYEFYSFLYY